MALFNRVNEFLNKVATLSKWKIVPDRGKKSPKVEIRITPKIKNASDQKISKDINKNEQKTLI